MLRNKPLTPSTFKRAPAKEAKRRQRKCVVCRMPFEPRSMTHKACSPLCSIEHVLKERSLKERRERQVGLQKLKRRADYLKEAQTNFNAFIRMRDRLAGYPCISSGRPLDWSGNQADCGHYRSTGSAPHLRFNEDNAHAQSKHDNRFLAGNAVDYRIQLIKRIGLERVEALEADDTPRKWSIEQLIEIKQHYSAKVRAAKKEQQA